jgi:hypothetical protein
MSKNRPATKGYLKKHTERGEPMFLVGAEDLTSKPIYRGPEAQVTWDDTWLNISTDPYEGHVMLNIEALPYLRQALAEIDRKRRTSGQSSG